MATTTATRKDGELVLLGGGPSFRAEIGRIIENSAVFSDLLPSEIEIIAGWAKLFAARKGDVIFAEGERNSSLCIVAAGRVEIVKEASTSKRETIAAIGAGRTVGEMGIIDGSPHSATAIAAQDSTVLLLAREHFQELVEHHPTLGAKLIWTLAKQISLRLRRTTGQLVDYIDRAS